MITASDNAVTKLTWRLPQTDAGRLADAIEDQTGDMIDAVGIWQDDEDKNLWTLDVYVQTGQDPAQVIKIVTSSARALGIAARECELEVLDNRNWVAEGLKELEPVHAGRFFVHGRHDRGQRRAGGVNLELDAGLAFGTGHHGTTLGCLKALDRVLKHRIPQNMLDLGCGTGILAIAVARATSKPVMASDIDPIAVEVTRANAKANKVAPLVTAVTAAGTNHATLQARAPYDLIMANILARPLRDLAPHITPLLAHNAALVLSGLLQHQTARIIARYRAHGLVLAHCDAFEGWATLTLARCSTAQKTGR